LLQTETKLCSLQIVLPTADIELMKERVLRVMCSISWGDIHRALRFESNYLTINHKTFESTEIHAEQFFHLCPFLQTKKRVFPHSRYSHYVPFCNFSVPLLPSRFPIPWHISLFSRARCLSPILESDFVILSKTSEGHCICET